MNSIADRDLLDDIRTRRSGLINLARLQGVIKQAGCDALIAVSPTNVTYTGGVLLETFKQYWLLSFVVTTADMSQGVVINEGDGGFFREYSWIGDVRTFGYVARTDEMNLIAIELLAQMLDELGLTKGKLGIEAMHLPARYWRVLQARMPQATLTDASHAFEVVRMVKTPEEIAVLREATRCTERAIVSALPLARVGDSEKQLASRIQGNLLHLGADALGTWTDLQSGPNSTIPHTWPSDAPMRAGDIVHIDTGAFFGGYITGLACNAAVEDHNLKQEETYSKLWQIKERLIPAFKPGAELNELYWEAEADFVKSGLRSPWCSIGYGIGLQKHECFEIAPESSVVLEPGMVVNLSLNHIEEGDARYHIEETLVITDIGREVLSTLSKSETLHTIG